MSNKEQIFNLLAHRLQDIVEEARALDDERIEVENQLLALFIPTSPATALEDNNGGNTPELPACVIGEEIEGRESCRNCAFEFECKTTTFEPGVVVCPCWEPK